MKGAWFVRSAEAPNGAASIPGAAASARRIVEKLRSRRFVSVPETTEEEAKDG